MQSQIYTAPPNSGTSVLGRTLPSLLYDAPPSSENPSAFHQPVDGRWRVFSRQAFRQQAEAAALGLLDVGLKRGDRVALYMESDVYFCIADMGCLIAGLIDVPIYLTHAPEQVQYVMAHAEARALIVTSFEELGRISGILSDLPDLRYVVVVHDSGDAPPPMPGRVALHTLARLQARGRHVQAQDPDRIPTLLQEIRAEDVATIIYTSGTAGLPKGVMLSHQNISHNALTAFSGLPDYRSGSDGEIALSFLPLTHVFARTLHYGFLYHGTTVFFSSPDKLREDLKAVRPTIFASVPRVLEKVYSGILKRIAALEGVRRSLADWALALGQRYELDRRPEGLYRLQLAVVDRLVFRKWRAAMGGRVKYIISGGAALSAELANLFAAAGVIVLQGYGLTETSPVITFNRPDRNRAGTVGVPIPGVEVRIAEDGEILTRGPHVMLGYYKDEERTHEAIDQDGWLHTGDIGEVTPEGFLRITDRKKDLFKLSTGKYVTPQILESRLAAHPLIEQAIVVGSGFKYCTALIFPEHEALLAFAHTAGLAVDRPMEQLLDEPAVQERFQQLVDEANAGIDPWSTIKKFALIPDHLSIESGLLTPTMKVRRSAVRERYSNHIAALYADDEPEQAFHGMEV